jgi:hypothetical protein
MESHEEFFERNSMTSITRERSQLGSKEGEPE